MSVTIENCSDKVVTVRFNNQVSEHLGPGQKLVDIAHSLVAGNNLIKKLQDRNLITLSSSDNNSAEKKAAAKSKPVADTTKSSAGAEKPASGKSSDK